jgi:aminocarboxymuconate-semialdehyde decarboxylase
MEYVIRKLGPGGSDRIVLGSDYPFPLGEVPVAGRMLIEDERVGKFMSYTERAGILAQNAIRFLKLGPDFEERFEERLRQFEAVLVDEREKNGGRDGWRHRDSAIELDGDDELGKVEKLKPVQSALQRLPEAIGSQ